jgi:hypothetical protein
MILKKMEILAKRTVLDIILLYNVHDQAGFTES